MRYLHTMIRVTDLERAKRFYTEGLGFVFDSERRYEDGRFTLASSARRATPRTGR